MYRISDSITIYNASDKSGVLVFVAELNKIINLAPQIGLLLSEWSDGELFVKDTFMEKIQDADIKELEHVWDTLVLEKVLVEEH